MNKVVLLGRLTKDPELRSTQSGASVCQFSIAVDRKYKSEGQPTADFINCVAWRKTAEFICNYFAKGSRIALVGQIQTRTYDDNDGKKVYVTEVIVDEVEFCESKRQAQDNYATTEAGYYDGMDEQAPAATATPQRQQQQAIPSSGGYFDIDDEGIPF